MKFNLTQKLTWLILILLAFNQVTLAQQQKTSDKPVTLKHWMTPEEAKLKHLIGKDARFTDPPAGPVTNLAEFDKMQSVLIRYSFGISYSLIAGMSQKCVITTIVASINEKNYVLNQYTNQGVNVDNCEFLIAPSDSYWTRDYGPWFVFDGNDELGIIDFTYNRPRPTDNAIPAAVASEFGFNLFAMDIITAGGNYMTDGMGISASSDLIWEENPNKTHAEIAQIYEDYLGIQTYHVVDDPNNTYIDHIDCWGKFLDVDKVLIRSVPPSHPQYDEIEATAAYFESQISSYGVPFQVFRAYTPNNEPYTNSLILNGQVFVPITNSQWDDEALATYEEAMPGYEIFGFTGSWESTDALHCRTKGIADQNMVHIRHIPLLGDQPVQLNYEIEATIKTFSGENLNNDSVLIYYRANGGEWLTSNMTNTTLQTWAGNFPGASPGSQIDYYIYAADILGNHIFHPFIGQPDPHTFFVGEQAFAHISITPGEIYAEAQTGQTTTETITICNTGQLEMYFDISTNTSIYDSFEQTVPNSPAASSYDYNTWLEASWTEFEVPNAGELAGVAISFTWDTDTYPEESSFHLLSPAGTETIIAAGIPDGNYSVDMTAFNGEEMNGTWRIWIQDTYGDGGHQVTNISLTFTYVISEIEWLSANPATGTIQPGDCLELGIFCNAAELEVGLYDGYLIVSSNDPDYPEMEIPVHFEVTELGQLATSPDTLWFIDPNSVYEGKTATITNTSGVDVTINEIQEGNWSNFGWYLSNVSQTLPHILAPNEELTFHVGIEFGVMEELVFMAYDSVHISSDAGDKYVNIAIDIELIPGSIDENDHHGIKVYPSPFTELLTIDLNNYHEAVSQIGITDLKGRLVKAFNNSEIFDNRLIWNCNNSATSVKNGIYLIQIVAGENTEVIKVVKMN